MWSDLMSQGKYPGVSQPEKSDHVFQAPFFRGSSEDLWEVIGHGHR